MRRYRHLTVLMASCAVCACAATTTAIGKRDLDVQTLMSESIFLDPTSPDKRTVFVQVRNTSDQGDLDVGSAVTEAISTKGYRLVDDPDQARYMLQVNVLQAGKSSKTSVEEAFNSGFGGAVVGGGVGALGARAASTATSVIIGGGLLGAATEMVTGSFIKDVTYTVITDLQVSERAHGGMVVTETLNQDLPTGAAGSTVIKASRTTDWKRYRTRVVSMGNRVNLEFDDAAPELVAGLTRSIAGIF